VEAEVEVGKAKKDEEEPKTVTRKRRQKRAPKKGPERFFRNE